MKCQNRNEQFISSFVTSVSGLEIGPNGKYIHMRTIYEGIYLNKKYHVFILEFIIAIMTRKMRLVVDTHLNIVLEYV